MAKKDIDDTDLEVLAVMCEVHSEALAKIAKHTRDGKMTLALIEWEKMKNLRPLGIVDDLMKKHFKL